MDYHLQSTSPCIDTGDPNTQYNDTDGSRNDMGIYGGPDAKDPLCENAGVYTQQSGSASLITYSWTQTGGPQTSLNNLDTINPTFTPRQEDTYSSWR